MKCADFENMVFDYVENTNTIANSKLKNHAENCTSCRNLANKIAADLKMLEQHSLVKAPMGFEQRLMQKIAEQKQEQNSPRMAQIAWWLAAAVFVGLFIGLALGNIYPNAEMNANYTAETEYYLDDFQQETLYHDLLADNN